jgi:hypothetical protein
LHIPVPLRSVLLSSWCSPQVFSLKFLRNKKATRLGGYDRNLRVEFDARS